MEQFLETTEAVAMSGGIAYRWGGVEIFDGTFEDFVAGLPIRWV